MVLERLNLNVDHFENKIMLIFYNYKPVSYKHGIKLYADSSVCITMPFLKRKQTSAVRKYETIYLEYPLYN